jgi:acyl-CoA carboxylase subunit beta
MSAETAVTAPSIPDTADDVRWTRCPQCAALIYLPRLDRNLDVCPECGHHQRIGADRRIGQLVDAGSWVPGPVPVTAEDALGFADRKPYRERLAEARRSAGPEAAVYGTARIAGEPIVIVVMDFAFLGGSMGAAVGETVTVAAETALERSLPLIVVTASGGARMQEGCISLMQMAKTTQAFAQLRENGILTVGVLTDPTFGGVTASFAVLGDILIGEAGALVGFAGPRVVQQSTGQRLPDGFQRAEFLLEHGLVDRVEQRGALRSQLARIIRLGVGGAASATPAPATLDPRDADAVIRDPGDLPPTPAWETLRTARDTARPTTLDYAVRIFDEFVELHGDRLSGDDPAVVGGLASLGGRTVVLVGHQKGHNTPEQIRRNFGMPQPAGYRKALRLMSLADRLRLPIVTLVDTQGAFPGRDAEEHGQAWAIADSILGMSQLRVPVVTVITGEGGSGGALALAVANEVLMTANACYSVISPESCSTILFGDQSHAPEMAESLHVTAGPLLRLGIVDGVVPEPEGGTQADHARAAGYLSAAIVAALDRLAGESPEELRRRRFARFRAIGELESRDVWAACGRPIHRAAG